MGMIDDYLFGLDMNIVEANPDHAPEDDRKRDIIISRIKSDEGESYCLMKHNRPISLYGAEKVNETTAEIWNYVFEPKYAKTILKVAKHQIDEWLRQYNRLQSVIRADDVRSLKFNEHIGLECEALLEQYRHDHDVFIYRRLS